MTPLELAVVALLAGTRAALSVLSVLNVRHARRTLAAEGDWVAEHVPVEAEDLLPYLRARAVVTELQGWTLLAAFAGLVAGGVVPAVTDVLATTGLGPVGRGAAFVVGANLLVALLKLPFSAVGVFVVEERFGFNEQSVGTWLRDTTLSLVLQSALFAPLAAVAFWLLGAFPGTWWLLATGVLAVLLPALQLVVPRFVAPLFDDYEPLAEGALRTRLTELFDTLGADVDAIQVCHKGEKTTRMNAGFSGVGPSKRVVLWDTMLDGLDEDAIAGIVAHEVGHERLHHLHRRTVVTLLQAVVLLFALDAMLGSAAFARGFGLAPGADAAVFVVGFVALWPAQVLLSAASNWQARRQEFAADAFAVETTGDRDAYVEALVAMTDENMSNPFPHPVYATLALDHPPTPERIRHLPAGADADAARPTPGAAGTD